MTEINEQMNENILELTDEEGNVAQFENLLVFEYAENFYIALLPVEPLEDMEDGEVLLMRVVEGEEEDTFMPVETEEELEGAWNAFIEEYYGDCEDDCGEHGCDCGCGHDHHEH